MWVSIKKRKPTKEGFYYWKGKSNYGGRVYYTFLNQFEFDMDIPVNKVSEEYLYWLDEKNIEYED